MRLGALAPILALAMLPRPAPCALPIPSGGTEEPKPTLFLREEEALTHALALAEGYEKAEAWKEAADQVQKVLDADADVLVPVGPDGAIAPQGAERYGGARARILARLARWPPAGRQALSALSEGPALARWLHAGNDAGALGQIASRFPFSSIADKAMSRLADVWLEAGEDASAVGVLETLRSLHPGSPCCGASLQERRKAALARLEAGPRSPTVSVPWTGRPGATPSARAGLPRWTFLVDPGAEEAHVEYLRRGLAQPQPYLPVCVGDLVLLGTSRGLNALERATGRLRWSSGEPGSNALVPGPCAPAVADGHCLLLLDGRLAAYELSGGRKVWETPQDVRAVTPPAVHGSVAYLGLLESSGPKVTFAACALRVRDGRILWRRHVTTSFDRAPLGEGPRGAVAVGEGRVVFSTDMGCVMALDPFTGDPHWLVRYDAFRESDRRLAARAGARWDPNPVLLAEGQVLVAPRDAAWLLCLGEKEGDLLWREARQGATGLLGAAAGRVFLSGPSGVRAISLADAHPDWATLMPVSGRGWLGDGTLVLPSPEGPAVLEASSGQVLHRDRWPDGKRQGGNLLPSGDLVLLASASRLTACEEASVSRERLEAGVRDGRPEAVVDLARLLLQEGDAEGALQILPPGAGALRAEALAHKASEAESRADWASAGEAWDWAACASPERDRRLLQGFKAGENWQRAGRPDRALASFQRMLREEGSLPWRYGELRSGWAARLAIEEVLRTSGREVYAPFDAEAEAMLRTLVPGGEEATLQEILSRYPNSLAAPRAALALGQLVLSRHAPDLAQRYLVQARQEGDAATSRAAGELLLPLSRLAPPPPPPPPRPPPPPPRPGWRGGCAGETGYCPRSRGFRSCFRMPKGCPPWTLPPAACSGAVPPQGGPWLPSSFPSGRPGSPSFPRTGTSWGWMPGMPIPSGRRPSPPARFASGARAPRSWRNPRRS
jgi:outer membrane protein assembly factor BamB